MITKEIWLLEKTKGEETQIQGFYSTRGFAIDAIRRKVNDIISKEVTTESKDVVGVYVSVGFLLTRAVVEVDEAVAFEKIETGDEYHTAEDLGDVQ